MWGKHVKLMESENVAREPQVAYIPEILSLDQLDLSRQYTFADYFRWKFEERVELIKGFIHKMCPAPGPTHQSVSGFLTGTFFNFFKGRPCTFFAAPFDVRLPDSEKQTADELIYTVVQPDLCVICDLDKIDKRGCLGAPDLVVEVLSPGNTQKEMGLKFRLYEENGIKEYWFVHPSKKTITVYSLQNGKYTGNHFSEKEEVSSVRFPELKFSVGEAFDRKLFEWFENIVREPEVAYGPDIPLPAGPQGKYTYTDYLQWDFRDRLELIKGDIHRMGPPSPGAHQKVARQLTSLLEPFFKNKASELITSPSALCFRDSEDDEVFTVVHPDFAVVSDPLKKDKPVPTPDLVIEILTPQSASTDVGVKYKIYEEHGVKEYWLVDPEDKVILINVLQGRKYVVLAPFTEEDEVCSSLFTGLRFGVREVFD